jgi:hypothetical protein
MCTLKKFIFILFLIVVVQGCKGSSSVSTSSTSSPTANLSQLAPVIFADSFYYTTTNAVSEWTKIDKAYLESGKLPVTITVPAGLVNTSIANADSSVQNSLAQQDPSNTLYNIGNNVIRYFALVKQDNVKKYVFEYKRYTTTSTGDIKIIQSQFNGEFDIIGGYAYLPLVNDKFGGNLFDANSKLLDASSFTHSISVTALSDIGLPSIIKKFTFKLDLQTEVTGISTKIAPALNATMIDPSSNSFNFDFLKTRWVSYYGKNASGATTEGSPNQSFDVAIIDNGQSAMSEPIATDIRFVFKVPPVLKMSQELFVEVPIDLDTYRDTKVINFKRGLNFLTRTIELNSIDHFKSSFKVSGSIEPLNSNYEIIHKNIPANTNWDLTLSYNFNQNPNNYSASLPLLNPLRPECSIVRNTQFLPVSEVNLKAQSKAAGGYYASCHPDTNNSLTLNQSQVVSTSLTLKDTWNDYFAYRSNSDLSATNATIKDFGHFYGIKSVKFYASGCIKFFIRPYSSLTGLTPWDTTPSNTSSSQSVAKCGEPGWSWFEFSVSDDIGNSNHSSEFTDSVLGPLRDLLINKPYDTRPDYMFNGTVNLNSIF